MQKIISALILIATLTLSCSQEKNLIRKASNAVERSNFDEAISYYDQVLAKDSNSYFANAGKGVVLSEYIGRHEKAIPYLEKALKQHPKKTGMKINYDLGKSYHFVGNFPRALYFFGETERYNTVKNPDYDMFLTKRIADSKYAMEHPEIAPPEQQTVTEVGNAINTSAPEYGAVYTHGKLFFTSKRKDDDKEKKNGIDGRFFDAMYVSSVRDGVYGAPRRYTVPDTRVNENFSQPHESVVSVSPDAKILYIFRAGQLYEVELNDSTKSAHKLGSEVNISNLQSHATISADGNMMIFASEAKRGMGGIDLYKTVKVDGKWSSAELFDNSINTVYNEDAPFLASNGTLFFASNGLPGYGGYDVYKTKMVDGRWETPQNLGQPINSPGDDSYFALNAGTSNGYFTSVRLGGEGEMDIYQVHYTDMAVPACNTTDPLFVIKAEKQTDSDMSYVLMAESPSLSQNKIRSFEWQINGAALNQSAKQFQYTFSSPGTYTLNAKAIIYCDTCPNLIALCTDKILEIGVPMLALNDSLQIKNEVTTTNKIVKQKNELSKTNNNKPGTSLPVVLNDSQLKDLKWNAEMPLFDLNKSDVREDAFAALNENIGLLKQNKSLALNINGYADSRGSEAYNEGLSLRRANAIKTYLIANGVAKNRILKTTGYGENNLLNNCEDGVECSEAEHQVNRRVQFEVMNILKTPRDFTLK
jgi:outer membrane protein OmpA-like peptidoglycan-associated protein